MINIQGLLGPKIPDKQNKQIFCLENFNSLISNVSTISSHISYQIRHYYHRRYHHWR